MNNHLSRPLVLLGDHAETRAGEGQCDCACVTAVTTHPYPHTHDCACSDINSLDTPLRLNPDRYHVPMGDGLQTIVATPGLPLVLNDSAWAIATQFQQPTTLRAAQIHYDDPSVQEAITHLQAGQLLQPFPFTPQPLQEQPSALTAWLHITDRCNLRCAYCYLPHKRQDMSLATGQAAIDATIRSARQHGYHTIKLKYAGGEPLIRFETVLALHTYAQEQAAGHGLRVDGVVLSNGTLLTPERVSSLKQLGLRLMVSLDGLQNAHDSQRFYANGHGSFSDVARGIERALALGLIPDISITVTSRNAAALPELMDWILARDLPFSLNFYRENDFSQSFTDLQLAEQRIIAGMLATFDRIEANLPRRSLLASLIDRANLAAPHLRTCGVGHSYLVFNEQGLVSKCQMQMKTAVTTAHDPDPLHTIRLDTVGLQNPTVLEKESCRHCEWRYWCTGGCPLATYQATGRYDVKSPNCRIYKALFPEAVRLEGLRILEEHRTSK